jgi:glutathionylspermidine synthase
MDDLGACVTDRSRLSATKEKPHGDYDAFAERVVASGIVTDAWVDGQPRLSESPLFIGEKQWREVARVAEDVAELYDELCQLVDDDDALLDDFFALTPAQKLMWNASRPLWHGFARADVFATDEGYCISELNSDTPTGEAEAVVLGALALERYPDAIDPNRMLENRFCAMVEVLIDRLADEAPKLRRGEKKAIGIVYPTEFTEDLSVIRLYRRWLEARGYRVVLGSPYNLGLSDDRQATLFDVPVSAIVRHYKTDWWGERQSAWDDEDLVDALPLGGPLARALTASVERRTAIINPFGAVVPQNKRSMAFMWEHIHRFSTRAKGIIEKHVPYTSRLETVHGEMLLADREGWVLKSDYGAEGEEVIVGQLVDEATWAASLTHARPGRWIAQRFFQARNIESSGDASNASDRALDALMPLSNLGVFLIGGQASGLYVRTQAGATDDGAVSVPVLIAAEV